MLPVDSSSLRQAQDTASEVTTIAVTDLERIALRRLRQAEEQGKALEGIPWDKAAFDAWVYVDKEAQALVAMSGDLRFWVWVSL